MNIDTNEMTNTNEDKEPIYYAPKLVSLVSDTANILSWIVLVGFIGDIIFQILSIQSQIKSAGYVLADLMKQSNFIAVIFSNLLVPLLTGVVFFVVLQAAANGLNVLLEMDFNAREAKSKH